MRDPEILLQRYSNAFRELINDRVWDTDGHPAKALRLNREADWGFVCVAMDIVDDASEALANFLRFGLDGPTKHDDIGEKYLRLYGILSAAYVQQQAVLKLYGLMNCPNPKLIKAQLEKLDIRLLRHQLASHSLDYLHHDASEIRAFVPIRVCLSNFTCTVTENRGDKSVEFELDVGIREHIVKLVDILDLILEKSVKTVFRGNEKKLGEFDAVLDSLRFERDGGLIVRAGSGDDVHEIRIVGIESRPGAGDFSD